MVESGCLHSVASPYIACAVCGAQMPLWESVSILLDFLVNRILHFKCQNLMSMFVLLNGKFSNWGISYVVCCFKRINK